MIANYSDPIVTLNQVYRPSQEGAVPALGACIIGPHYIVRKQEDFGEDLRLDSSINYAPSEYNTTYTAEQGLTTRPYPARLTDDGEVDGNSVKVLVKDAQIEFMTLASDSYTTSFDPAYTTNDVLNVKDSNNQPFVFNGIGMALNTIPVTAGDAVEVAIVEDTEASDAEQLAISCYVQGTVKDDNNRYTKLVLSKSLPAGYAVKSLTFAKVRDCYVDAGYFTASSTAVSVDGNAKATMDLGTGAEAYTIKAGAFYAEYRVRSDKFVGKYGQVSDIDYVDDLLGKVCAENPLGIAVANAVEESAGNFVYFTALPQDSDDDDTLVKMYLDAADLIADKDGIYGIVPCTTNKAVIKALFDFVKDQSSEEIPYFKYLYASCDIPTEAVLVEDAEVATVTEASNSQTKITFTGSPLLEVGTIKAGDTVKGSSIDAVVITSNHKDTLYVEGDFTLSLVPGAKVSIYKTLDNNSDIIEAIIADKSVADKKASIAFADGAMYNFEEVPNYCAAAALAGKRSGSEPHAPLSNVTMKALTCTEAHGFTASESKRLGAAGFWRIGMNEEGECISKRQLTSAASGDVNYDEQSIVCNIDSIGFALKKVGRDLVGNTNISDTLLDILEVAVKGKLASFEIPVNEYIGPQLLSSNLISIKQDAVYKDRIYAEMEGEPPKPFNRFHMTFYMV